MDQDQKSQQQTPFPEQNGSIFVPTRNNTDLNAKLNQGYNASTEFNDRGQLLSSVALWTLPANYTSEILQPDALAFKDIATNDLSSNLTENDSALNIEQLNSSPANNTEFSGQNITNDSNRAQSTDSTEPSSLSGLGGVGASDTTLNQQSFQPAQGTATGFDGPAQSSQRSMESSPSMTGTTEDETGGTDPAAPSVIVAPTTGAEDQQSSLNIQVTPGENQDPADISVLITGIPAGATLSAGIQNPDNSWTLTIAELTNLKITPPNNYSGVINIQVTATSSSDGLSTTSNSSVTVAGVADAPTLSVMSTTGAEDSAIALTINAALVDNDGSETLSITIGNMPAGASLSAGTNNGNGTWTLTPAQLSGLTITPPQDFNGTLNLSVTATSSESGTTATTTDSLSVTVSGTADAPTISSQTSTGNENQSITLNVSVAPHAGDNNATISVIIGNVPTGSVLSAGINNGDGTWTLTPAQLTGLTFTPPTNTDGQFNLSVTATSTENGTTATSTSTISVTVIGEAQAPTLSVAPTSGAEDSAIALTINAALTDNDGSETLSVTIGNVPAGATLSAGTNNGNGTWTLTPAQLTGLTITPPQDFNGTLNLSVTATSSENGTTATATSSLAVTVTGTADAPTIATQSATGTENQPITLNVSVAPHAGDNNATLSVTIGNVPTGGVLSAGINNGDGTWTLTPAQLTGLTFTPPANADGQFNLSVTATSTENGTNATSTGTVGVTVSGEAQAPTLSVTPTSGAEDSAIALNINAALTDNDGSETLSVTIGNVPAGATLSAGTNNGNGTWTLTSAQLSGLTITPPQDFNGTLNLSVTATSSENGTTATTTTPLAITVTGVADAPTLSTHTAVGDENQPIALNVSVAPHAGDNNATLSVTIGNVPPGGTLSAGIDNGDGTWTLTPAQLSGLSFNPPSNFTGTLNFSVTALATENGTTATSNGNIGVTVVLVGTTPTVTFTATTGSEDQPSPLDIHVTPGNGENPADITIQITGVPTGATLSAGIHNPDDSWTLTMSELTNLTITPPANYSGTLNLQVTATCSTDGYSDTANSSVTIDGVADAPTLSVMSTTGAEDSAIALTINAALVDNDGSENLSITIGNVPAGAILSAGTNNGNGTWTLTSAQLSGLTITPPQDFNGTMNLSVSATSSENGTSATTTSTPLSVTVTNVADAPTISTQTVTGNENQAIALNVSVAPHAGDNNATLSVTIGNVPTGGILSAGINNGDGTWTLTPAQLTGLTFTPPANADGQFNLSVTATSSDNGTTATSTSTIGVTVNGEAQAPTLSVTPTTGAEDTAIALTINAALVDTDGSETLSVTIGNVPTGATLSAGTNNGNGTWTLTSAQLSGLTITPPQDFSGTLNLSVAATSSENGTTATTTSSVAVTVTGVADAPNLTTASASGPEDSAIALTINTSLVDNDGSEVLSVTIGNMPAGATLSAGTNNGNGTWTLTPAQLSGLSITPPQDFNGTLNLNVTATSSEAGTTATSTSTLAVTVTGVADAPTITSQTTTGNENQPIALNVTVAPHVGDNNATLSVIIGNVPTGGTLSAGVNNGNGTWTLTPAQLTGLTFTPPANADGQFNLSITATATENGTTATSTGTVGVTVNGVAEAPTLSVMSTTGAEDSAIALTINAALVDTDGSETLSVTISNIPAGATLSAGTNNGNGTWTLTSAQLSGLTLTPPQDFNGTLNLSVTATSSENGTTATASSPLTVTVTGVADAPTLSTQASTGTENQAIALNVSVAPHAGDNNATLSVTIGNVPTGGVLSAGINNGNGTWTLTPAQLTGLTFTPPANADGQFNLSVTATSTENGTTATSTSTLGVTVNGEAQAPTLSVMSTTGSEDSAIALTINAALVDTDGSETLSITIGNVPAGAVFSAGTNNGNGTWTLTSAQLSGLTITPPQDFNGTLNLSVTATSSENGTTATTTSPLAVTVTGVADAPTISTQTSTGTENHAIALNVMVSPHAGDNNATLSVTIGNVPTGGVLSAGINNGDGTWTLTPAQLAGLSFTPPTNTDGQFNLSVTATSTENGTTATSTSTVGVTVNGEAQAPTLSVMSTTGAEDSAIALTINAALVDNDGSETLWVVIFNVPAGATLSAGTDNGDGTWTLTPPQLTGLTLTPPLDFNGTINLSITAASTENGTVATTTSPLVVTVTGVADAPTLSTQTSAGNENQAIALNVSVMPHAGDNNATLSVTIGNVPTGGLLSAGINNGDGTWTLSPAQLSGLTFTPPLNADGQFNLSVTAYSSENGTTASSTGTIGVNVAGVATAPALSVSPATGSEDTQIRLFISANLTDTDGSETLSIVIGNVPTGGTLSAGVNNGNGTWTLSPSDLGNLTFTPPLHASGSYSLSVSAISAENGTTASTSSTLNINVDGVATQPTLSVATATGLENASVALTINAALNDTDGSETLSILISNVPAGATLSAGIDKGNGIWSLAPSDLNGLSITPPLNYTGTINLSVTAISSENGTLAQVTSALPVTIDGVAMTPTLSLPSITGNEDTAIALNIGLTPNASANAGEVITVTISNVPTGAILSAGTNNGNGTWTLTSAQIAGLTLTPAHDWSGTLNLGVSATASENGTSATTTGNLSLVVNGVADAPTVSVQAATGSEGDVIALQINAALTDIDGSEALSIVIGGLPTGATLSAGTNNGNGTWTLTPAQLSGLNLIPAAHYSGNVSLSVSAISSENGTTATTSTTLGVSIAAVATAPSLSVQSASGLEDTPIALNINAALLDTDGSETLSVTIHGVPPAATLSAGVRNGDGSWTLAASDLTNLTLTPPLHWAGNLNLSVTATSSEGGLTADTTLSLPVTVAGVATAPTLSVQSATGLEDSAIALNINAALVDTDGSETLSVVISGIPAGSTLSAGTHNANGTWTLSPAQLSGLTLTPPLHWSGTLNLQVAAISAENGTTAQVTQNLPVTITGIALPPTLSVGTATGQEDHSINLSINAALVGAGTQVLDITISNVPAGGVLSAGVNMGNGIWHLAPADLTNLTLTPPANWSGDINLSVTATSTENGEVAATQSPLHLIVTGVADTPTLSVQAAMGVEDASIPLSITAGLTDTDGSETLTITIGNMPAGSSLSAGTNNGNGTWTLTAAQATSVSFIPPQDWSGSVSLLVTATSSEDGTTSSVNASLPITVTAVADTPVLNVQSSSGLEDTPIALHIDAHSSAVFGAEVISVNITGVPTGATLSAGVHNPDNSWTVPAASLATLTLNPPLNYSGNFSLNVTATASENGTTAVTTSVPLMVSVAGVADAPTVSVQVATGAEGTAIPLTITAGLTDTDGSELLSIIIGNLPTGATLSAGTLNANGTWTVTPANLASLSIIPGSHWNGSTSLSVTAVSSENGTTASTTTSLPLLVTPVADVPNLSVLSANGFEDTPVALNITSSLAGFDVGETLSIKISNLPVGATLSAGTNNAGTWTLTPAQLVGLTLIPPTNWSGTSTMTIVATSTEGATTASATTTLYMIVTGVADAPTLSVSAASGLEDHNIPLSITTALTDTDGSESLLVHITGVPSGATLSAGTRNPDGSWTLNTGHLVGLSFIPAANWSGSVNLTVTSLSAEGTTNAATTAILPVTVGGVADTPVITVSASSGNEDTAIALHIGVTTPDTDGSETVSVNIAGVPSGATLSAGIKNANGTWTLTPAQLTNLTITPAANYNGAVSLTVTATTSENGTTATATSNVPLVVLPIPDAPTLGVSAAAGLEDSAIPLSVTAALTASNETLSIVISGLPAGATLSAGLYAGNNKWSLAPSDLVGLKITPPLNYSGTMALQATAVSTDGIGGAATVTVPFNVVVTPVADAPTLSVAPAKGFEDTAISLNIQSALTDTDTSESLSITISGVPTGAVLSAGTNLGGGIWSVSSAQLAGLKITPPTNSDTDFSLTVTSKSTESANGTSATTVVVLPVTVIAVADVPTVSASGGSGAAGTQINLSINGAATDSSETLTYIIHGIPDGFALNKGINNGDNSWTLSASQLTSLSIISPPTFNGKLTLYAQSVSHDNDNSIASSATTPFTVTVGAGTGYLVDLGVNAHVGGLGTGVHVGALPDIDLLPASGGLLQTNGMYVKEDTPYMIGDAPNLLSSPLLSAVLSLVSKLQFSGVPIGTTFSSGTNKGGGVWEFTNAQLANLTMTTIANSDVDFTIVSTAKMLLGLADITLASTVVHVMGIADTPTLTASAATGGTEDNAIALNIAGALTDNDGSETLSFIVAGMPTDFTLNHGINNGNGTWSLTSSDLAGLTIMPAPNYSGTASFTVASIATEREGDQTVTQATVSVTVAAVADAPTITASSITGNEDQVVGLNLNIAVTDTDGSESISAITISGLPTGASLTHATDNHNGTWSVAANEISQVQFVPAANWSGDANLSITATSRESSNGSVASTTTTIPVHINGVADTPIATATDSTGNMDNSITLHLGASLTDTDGSERLSVVISGVPMDAMLSAGLNNGNGSWTLSSAQLTDLHMTPANHFVGDINLSLTAISREDNGSTSSSAQSFSVHVLPAAQQMMMSSNSLLESGSWLDSGSSGASSAPHAADSSNVTVTPHDSGADYQHSFQTGTS